VTKEPKVAGYDYLPAKCTYQGRLPGELQADRRPMDLDVVSVYPGDQNKLTQTKRHDDVE